MGDAVVSALYVYPVKSLRGISLIESRVEKRGLKFDRRWMLVDEEGKFISQRDEPRLALFCTELGRDGLVLIAPCGQRKVVPYEPSGTVRTVQVWKDVCQAVPVPASVDRWLSEVTGIRCSLVFMPSDVLRPTNPLFTQPGDIVGFAEAYPVLAIGDASLQELNAKLDSALPMNRFRPNIVVSGWAAHEEDSIAAFRISGLEFRAAKRCARCSITATDQETGEVGVEPLRTLAKYRLAEQKVWFGAYFVPAGIGRIRVGDPVRAFVAA